MTQKITLGAGCFWCVEAVFKRCTGVQAAVPGYMGGSTPNPTYKQVCTGQTGHAEVAEVSFDENKISLKEVLEIFWKMHDPTQLNRQGNDVGTQYRSAIFYHSEEQKTIAIESRDEAQKKLSSKIVTEITPAATFYPAEDYHRDYYDQNKNEGYCRFVIHPKLQKMGFNE